VKNQLKKSSEQLALTEQEIKSGDQLTSPPCDFSKPHYKHRMPNTLFKESHPILEAVGSAICTYPQCLDLSERIVTTQELLLRFRGRVSYYELLIHSLSQFRWSIQAGQQVALWANSRPHSQIFNTPS